MTNPTNPFNWQMPTSSDLVTDLPADFEVFGQAVATSMADLLGGTSGQILAKASNTDMDFTWVTNDVGDITAVNTTAPLADGATSGAVTLSVTGATTSATGVVQLSDSTSTTSSVLAATPTAVKSAYDLANSAYAPAFTNNFYAAKNKILNGDFSCWQRGTSSFTINGYTADRWYATKGNGTVGVSQQTFTPGTAPASGYESAFYLRYALSGASTSGTPTLQQRIEDVRTFAGQTVTVSFWANASSSASPSSVQLVQNFGSGGSAEVTTTVVTSPSYTTSFVRYSYTVSVPSISGKTVGTSSYLALVFNFPLSTTFTSLDLWGVMIEAGSVVTPFQTQTGGIQQELAACQRYYFRNTPGTAYGFHAYGNAISTTQTRVTVYFPAVMRTTPSAIDFANLSLEGTTSLSTVTADQYGQNAANILTGGSTGLITSTAVRMLNFNNAAGYIGFSAEL